MLSLCYFSLIFVKFQVKLIFSLYLEYKYIMKKLLGVCFLSVILTAQSVFAHGSEVVTLDKNNVEKPELNIDKTQTQISGSLLVNDGETLENLIDQQQQHDLKDLEKLWKGTVENNQVIEFALKKLATPESQRRIHSSLMAKTLSAIISGASFVPGLVGANYGIQTASFSAGRLAQGLLNRKNIPQENPLTDTELIELASMIEDLQDSLISSYYNYKNTLSQLKDTRSKIILYNKNYTNALASGNVLEIAISSSLYDAMRIQEYNLEQDAKKYHIQLQRLAGKKVVDSLELYQYDFNSVLYKQDTVRTGGKSLGNVEDKSGAKIEDKSEVKNVTKKEDKIGGKDGGKSVSKNGVKNGGKNGGKDGKK